MKEFQRVEEGINDLSLGNIKNIIEFQKEQKRKRAKSLK